MVVVISEEIGFVEDQEPGHVLEVQVYQDVLNGADLVEACIMANAGAGYTVGMIGTSTVTLDALREEVSHIIKNGNLHAVKLNKHKVREI